MLGLWLLDARRRGISPNSSVVSMASGKSLYNQPLDTFGITSFHCVMQMIPFVIKLREHFPCLVSRHKTIVPFVRVPNPGAKQSVEARSYYPGTKLSYSVTKLSCKIHRRFIIPGALPQVPTPDLSRHLTILGFDMRNPLESFRNLSCFQRFNEFFGIVLTANTRVDVWCLEVEWVFRTGLASHPCGPRIQEHKQPYFL